MRSSTSLLRHWFSIATAASLLATVPSCTDDATSASSSDDPGMQQDTPPVVLERIDGTLVDRTQVPLAGKLVVCGEQMTTTDAAGHFSFTNVTAPYDIQMTETGASLVSTVRGLTSATPTLVYTYWPETREATITGTLSTPTKVGDHMLLGVTTPFSMETFSMYAPNFSGKFARWYGPTKATTNILALKYTKGANGLPISYEAIGSATLELQNGGTASGITLPAQDPTESTITGQLVLPPGATYPSMRAFAVVGDGGVELARIDNSPSFSVVVPSGVGITSGFTASATTPDGATVRFMRDVPTDTQGLQIDLAAPPHLVSPAAGSKLAVGDEITWTDERATLFVVEIGQYDATQKRYPYYSRTLTTAHSVTVPDLSSLGMHWDATRWSYIWIYAYDLPWTLEQAADTSLDTLLDRVWSSDGLTTIDGSVAFSRDGFAFPPTP